MAEKLKSVKVTWKEEEKNLHDYAWEHSSPSAWIKDLIKADMKKNLSNEEPKQNPGMFNFLD